MLCMYIQWHEVIGLCLNCFLATVVLPFLVPVAQCKHFSCVILPRYVERGDTPLYLIWEKDICKVLIREITQELKVIVHHVIRQ